MNLDSLINHTFVIVYRYAATFAIETTDIVIVDGKPKVNQGRSWVKAT